MKITSQRSKLIGSAMVLALLGGCAGGSDGRTADQAYVEKQVGGRLEGVARLDFYQRIEQLLPNREYEADGMPSWRPSERAAVGEFIDAERGHGFTPNGERFDFDSSEPGNRSIHFEFRVEENLAGDDQSNPIRVGVIVPSGTDFDRARQGFLDLGRVALILEKSPVFDYDQDLLSPVLDGTMIATIGPEGELALPFIEADHYEQMLDRVDTLDKLRKEAQKPPKRIKVRSDGGVVYPPDE